MNQQEPDYIRYCHLCEKVIKSGQSRTTLCWIDADGETQVKTVHRKCKENLLATKG